MIGSAFLVSNAKNDRLRLNNIESVILCVFMTDSIMLFSFYTAMLNNIESVILCVFMTDSIMLFSFYTAMLNI
ncbi:hypothetical protein DW004_13755, partial [Firmicutes bacterium AF36-3BH]